MTTAALTRLPRDWSPDTFILADIVHVLTGEKHPARPSPEGSKAEQHANTVARLQDHKRRMAEREAILAAEAPTT